MAFAPIQLRSIQTDGWPRMQPSQVRQDLSPLDKYVQPEINAGTALKAAADIRGQELTNEGTGILNEGRKLTNQGTALSNAASALGLEEAQAQAGALADFRETGDPNALRNVNPELALEIDNALRGLDDNERQEVTEKLIMLGEASDKVAALPQGSPEQLEVFQDQLGGLLENGVIDEAAYEEAIAAGPNPETIERAQVLRDIAVNLTKTRAKIGGAFPTPTPTDYSKIDEEAHKRTDAMLPEALRDPENPEAYQTLFEQNRADIMRERGLVPDTGEDAPSTAGPGGSEANPAKPTSVEEFDALAPGAWFINPADGRLLQKAE